MRIFRRSKTEPDMEPELTPAVAERFRHMAYGGSAPQIERDALLAEKQAMRRLWRWMVEHRPEEYERRKIELAEEMREIASELRAVEVILPRGRAGSSEPVRFGFRVTVPEFTPEEIEAERAKLLALYHDLAVFPHRCKSGIEAHQLVIDQIEISPITRAVRKVREQSRLCRTREEIEAELEWRGLFRHVAEPGSGGEAEEDTSV